MSVVLSRYLYFPFAEVLKGTPVTRHLRELERSQWLMPDDAAALTATRLAETIAHARKDSPFYRERLAALGEVSAVNAHEALREIPVLTKNDIFQHRDALRARRGRGRVLRGHTSGSGGEALEFFFTPEFLARTEAAQWRGRGWWGMRRGDAMLALWGRALSNRRASERVLRRERLRNWMRISAFELSHRDLLRHQERIERFRPQFIYGYSSAIYQLALFYSEHTLPPPQGLRAVFFTADALLSFQRRLVAETLRVPTACEYGSSEAGAFAFECREGGVHVAAENVVVEILRNGVPVSDGEEGEVVVTVLHNRAMPLIRYNLGDWARRLPGTCPCGRSLPRLELTNTKVVDLVRTSRGSAASGQFFDYILIELIDQGKRGIRQFLVIQKTLDRFVVQIIPGPEFGPECLTLFERRMREQLGNQIEVSFELVTEIPREAAGKIRCFRCEIEEGPRAPAPAAPPRRGR